MCWCISNCKKLPFSKTYLNFSQCGFYTGLSLRVLANLVSSLCANIECSSLLIHRLLAHTHSHTYTYSHTHSHTYIHGYVCVYSAYILCMIDQFACSAALWLDWCSLALFLSSHISLSYTLSVFSSLSLICFPPAPLWSALLCCFSACLQCFSYSFPFFFNTLSAGYQQEHSPCGSCLLSSVSSLQSFAVQAVQGVQGENSLFHISHLATAAKVIGLTTTTAIITTTTTQRVVMMDYR